MAKNYNAADYVYFVFAKSLNSGYGFATYQDDVGAVKDKNGVGHPGSVVYISYRSGESKHGATRDEPYYFNWNFRDRVVRVHKDQKDKNGVSIVEFLRNSPECKGSPNGSYSGDGFQDNVMYKEFNEENDAQKIIAAKDYRIKAENIAVNLTDEEVLELAPFFGQFTVNPTMARVHIMDAAGNKPNIFMDVYENPKRRAESLVRRAIQLGILKVNGTIVSWEKTTLGMDEQEAAAKVSGDDKLSQALEATVKKSL